MARLRKGQVMKELLRSSPPLKTQQNKGNQDFLEGTKLLIERSLKPGGGSKPGGFPLFSGKVPIVSRTLSGLFLVGALFRPRERKRTNRENPRSISPSKSGKSRKNRESPKKDKKGRTSPDRETPPPPFESPPRLKTTPFSGP